ncbi:long-chain-fatty-acid--CoA ligase [Desulfotruncus alcoholivorax]|uniref:long-chain-fatty-acid--CoA ligase n=1 Tax=Desulfotruncus alcoholivorax TaxID=265477 RepID=UPI0004107F6C|nr:long-chain fatty acid--CoA ligase [Desulfotruncus alcoholivorax]
MAHPPATGSLPWAGHYDRDVPQTLNYPKVPVFELFSKTIRDKPDVISLYFLGRRITYRELGEYVDSVACALMNKGIGSGDRVALLLPNCPQYIISYYALLMLGATVVPTNPLNTESELLHIVKDGGVKAAIALDLLAGRLEAVRNRCRTEGKHHLLEHTFYTSMRDFLPLPKNLLYPLKQKIAPEIKATLAKCGKFSDLLKEPAQLISSPGVNIFNEPAVLIYTGGTTGKPKGVMLSNYALVVNAHHNIAWVGISTGSRLLTVLPVFHGFGMSVCMNAPVIAGASIILLPRFDVEETLKTIHRFRPTLFAGVPTMYIALINHPRLAKYDLSSLQGCFVGAAPLAPEVKRRFEELTKGKLMEGYGLTEAVTAKCANPYRGINKTGSIGIPFPDTIMKVVDVESGEKELPTGEIGEIVIQSPDLMLGYFNRPEETANTIRNGWLYTGDLGCMDKDGYFYIVDRKKDLIITGGFNVYPREVEDVLYQHPAVREASVIGVPDDYRGEMVKAFITLKEGSVTRSEDIISFCKEHLVPYKVPRKIEICDKLPKTAIGKILKRSLREKETETTKS